jgi:SAM-dependent methyltransferase
MAVSQQIILADYSEGVRRCYSGQARWRGERGMDDLSLLIDLHRDGQRQGPGGADETRLAITLSGLRGRTDLRIADIGCGTGASSLVLAQDLDADITAVDFLPDFLEKLDRAARAAGLNHRITTHAASMEALTFADASLDAIWSEGAIYNMGFVQGIQSWRRFLKPGGILAVSELTWLTAERPAALTAYWMREYPEVETAAAKMAVLEGNGFAPMGYFVLPRHCWLDNYYRPLQARFADFLLRHAADPMAAELVAAEREEIALYERYAAYVSYGFYIARKTAE